MKSERTFLGFALTSSRMLNFIFVLPRQNDNLDVNQQSTINKATWHCSLQSAHVLCLGHYSMNPN